MLIKTSFLILFQSSMRTQNTDRNRPGQNVCCVGIARLLIKQRITSVCVVQILSGCVREWWMTRGMCCIPAVLYNQPEPPSIWASPGYLICQGKAIFCAMVLKVIPFLYYKPGCGAFSILYSSPNTYLLLHKTSLIQLWVQSVNDFLTPFLALWHLWLNDILRMKT